jgi:hypothetical protein
VLVILCAAAAIGIMAAVVSLAQPRQIAFMTPGQKTASTRAAGFRF